MSTTDSSDKDYEDDFEWTSYNEVQLIYAMGTLKPLGINQHFIMSIVIDKFCSAMGRNIPGNVIINKVESYYNLLDAKKKEHKPYSVPSEFSLPSEDFPQCINNNQPSPADSKKSPAKKKVLEKKPPSKRPRHTQ